MDVSSAEGCGATWTSDLSGAIANTWVRHNANARSNADDTKQRGGTSGLSDTGVDVYVKCGACAKGVTAGAGDAKVCDAISGLSAILRERCDIWRKHCLAGAVAFLLRYAATRAGPAGSMLSTLRRGGKISKSSRRVSGAAGVLRKCSKVLSAVFSS